MFAVIHFFHLQMSDLAKHAGKIKFPPKKISHISDKGTNYLNTLISNADRVGKGYCFASADRSPTSLC